MKKLSLLLMLFAGWQLALAQTEAAKFTSDQLKDKDFLPSEFSKQFLTTDFSTLWTHTENEYVFGFIGDDYQRIRVKIITVAKIKTLPNTYDVYGKSMVKSNVDGFHGTMKLTNIRKMGHISTGVDNEYKNKSIKGEYLLLGEYTFAESRAEKHSGIFKGTFRSDFYVDKHGKVRYDDIEQVSDSYTNNRFVGSWTPYGANTAKGCNWGDYRIPNSGDLDGGAGEFSPTKGLGWETVKNRWSQDKKIQAKAITAEKVKWWK
ncbi:MAG: hypothetical protein H7289_14540 [Mucilaginibacter sp.]|nr:hypothetical protein [Mucilaginibacter sp.]